MKPGVAIKVKDTFLSTLSSDMSLTLESPFHPTDWEEAWEEGAFKYPKSPDDLS